MRFVCAGTRYKLENNNCAIIERMSINSLSRLLKGFHIGNSPSSFSPGNRYGRNLASYTGTQNKTKRATTTKRATKVKGTRTRRAKTVKGRGTVERNGMNVERTQRKRTKTQKAKSDLVTLPSNANISGYLANGYTVERVTRRLTVLKPPPAATALSRRTRRKTGKSRAENRINRIRKELMKVWRNRKYK